jgi:hypothetical protein
MEVRQIQVEGPSLEAVDWAPLAEVEPQLVLVFACVEAMRRPGFADAISRALPQARRVGCSTAGEISAEGVGDHGAVITALRFDGAADDFRTAAAELGSMADSMAAGQRLAAQLAGPGLHSVLVLAQGVQINGSALIKGMTETLGPGVTLSGGLAGDGGAFERSFVLFDDRVCSRLVAGIGFYGETLRLAHGSFGGWQPFGPARKVTRAQGNVLYELDGEPALDIYRRYLGEYAKDLPSSGLLFPFSMLGADHHEVGLIRTILGIDEHSSSLVLAGDVIENGCLRLMHASTNALIAGAEAAARAALAMQGSRQPGLALLVSCVGRKLVMGGRVDEEVEAVASVFGTDATIAGFYSNGEISPYVASQECRLHNQTMTITCLYEQGPPGRPRGPPHAGG